MRTMTTKTPHPDFVLDPEQPIDAELPIEQAPAVMPEPIINPLFQNLVPDTPQTRSLDGKLSFADAMPRLGYSSVFDIIRQPKQAFARQLRSLSDADGEMAYDNALCYATQIARSYREEQVSSGRSLPQIAPQTGVRALVDVGPSYPNLFKENWDQFCKVGAIEAMDGPVAYLGSLRRFAEQRIEGASTSPKRIPLAVRRPDLDKLVIDEQSTYQSRPMLDLVNDVLTQGIGKYQAEKGDVRPVHELLAQKKHPLVFPYHFAHQQVSLALKGDKPALGELNHALVMGPQYTGLQPIDQTHALALLSGLSPAQQQLLIQPAPYAALGHALADNAWYTPIQSNTCLWETNETHIDIPAQPSMIGYAHQTNNTLIELRMSNGSETKPITLRAVGLKEGVGYSWPLNRRYVDTVQGLCFRIEYHAEDNAGSDMPEGYCAALTLNVIATVEGQSRIGRQLTIELSTTGDANLIRQLDVDEQQYMRDHLGVEQRVFGSSSLSEVKQLCDASALDAEQLQSLICRKHAHPKLSANCPIVNTTGWNSPTRKMPNPMNYGAVFINGNGGQDRLKPGTNLDQYDNALTLWQPAESSTTTLLANTSLDRFDRMQRMIRLQRWMNIPFAELDTLITSAMRSEGDANPGLHANRNTLRILGAYRYFDAHYEIGVEEFAAFVDNITPFATGDKLPLFDRVFNSPVLFDTPLYLDRNAFSESGKDSVAQKTISQLCAGLNLSPAAESFGLLAANVIAVVGPLKRSLKIVSAFYRQARMAQMFGIGVAECQYLLNLLGGAAYINACTIGLLSPRLENGGEDADVLDILMELDGVVRWLKANKLTVAALRELLDTTGSAEPSVALIERLQQLAGDALTQRTTPEQVDGLGLPAAADGTVINWYAQLRAFHLISSGGFIIAPEVTVQDTDHAQLVATVLGMLTVLPLAPEAVEPTTLRLSEWLADTLARQQRLVEGFMQEYTGLLPEQALLAARWAIVTPQAFLDCVGEAWPASGEPVQDHIDAVLQQLHGVTCAALGVKWSQLGARALRMFLAEPTWLGTATLWPQTLHTLHLLKAYESLFNTLGQPEERLLGYLELANTAVSKRPGKRQLATQVEHCNAAAASLLGWNVDDVAVLTATLPQGIAKTVAHLDWLRRAQAIALQTGLNGATLLQACALNADSPEADWQAVGQAAMAAVSA
jgi:hypothetical protein